MKNWTWKQWTALGIIAAVIIAAVVCHLVQPQVTYAWLEMVAGGTFVLGALVGYWLKKNDVVKQDSLLLD
jgi:hypothetical protein